MLNLIQHLSMPIETLTGQTNIDRFRVGARNDYKKGFTLAEVLITLGIIGVVAAMTIPNLMAAHKAHRYRTQFLKSYSTIQQAFRQMEADGLSTDPTSYSTDNYGGLFAKTFINYLKGATVCSYGRASCFNSGYYKTYGEGKTTITPAIFDDGQILLPDGTLLLFENAYKNNNGGKVFVSVDLNGWAGLPNRAGYDLFMFEFLDGELRVMGDRGTTYPFCDEKTDRHPFNGLGCAYKAKNDPEYFKNLVKYIK